MALHLVTVAPAIGFTLGCVAIHTLREHALALTGILKSTVIILTAVVLTALLFRMPTDAAVDGGAGFDCDERAAFTSPE